MDTLAVDFPFAVSEFTNPETGRRIRRLTDGCHNNYPLYYFIPSITADNRYLIFHSERSQWVQLYRLDMATGETVVLTDGHTRDSGWDIWCEYHLRGIFNHLSALNTVKREVYYFQDEQLRSTHVDTLANRLVCEMPGRMPVGQSSFSPDGKLFAFIHADAVQFRRALADRRALINMGCFPPWPEGGLAWQKTAPVTISVIETDTGKLREVQALDYHAHHVVFADNRRLLINHVRNDTGMWIVNTDGTGARDLRPRKEHGAVVHQVVTERGIFYEAVAVQDDKAAYWLGRYDLEKDTFEEVLLPEIDGYVHTGFDPAGKFLFFESQGKSHELFSLHFPFVPGQMRLNRLHTIAPYPAFAGQRHHAHPFLSPDRRWLFYTEVVDGFSQICAMDVADLVDLDEYWERRSFNA